MSVDERDPAATGPTATHPMSPDPFADPDATRGDERREVNRADLYDDATGHDHGRVIDQSEGRGAMWVLRRGIRTSPELRRGLLFTVLLAVVSAIGKLTVPVLIQQVVDRGIVGTETFDAQFIAVASGITVAIIAVVAVASRAAYIRLVTAAEAMLYALRVRAFAHIHRLTVADHDDTKRGELTARVTSDIEIIARFAQWAGVAWIVNSIVILGALGVMTVYSWRLALVTVVVFLPMVPIMRFFQRRQLAAYDRVRQRVGHTMSEVSEAVMGAGVIRAYGIESRARHRLHRAIREQYRAEMGAARYFALMFPVSDLFGGLALAAVVGVGAWYGPGWGLEVGTVLAFVFLVNLILSPIAEIGEILDQTQQGIAGWRRVFDLLDQPVDLAEPDPGVALPAGALSVRVEHVDFAYRGRSGDDDQTQVLFDVDLALEPGTDLAVVGETGSGKTTLAKLLCRLADPTGGRILVGGVDVREVAKASRNAAIRMVPQDGFLFDATVADNVRFGRPGADPDEVTDAFERLGLARWAAGLPEGLETVVGERGEQLSVGERQLVALARAQLADPGLLILDEATSAVDPETEQALSRALAHLTAGRTTVTVAHRLSTAEAADLVAVFDAGRIVEIGTHAELVDAGGVYAGLYASWLGNTRRSMAG